MTDKDQMIKELQAILKPYIQNEQALEDLSEETDFINDLKINSANLIDVILDIEEKYDIVLDNESMEQMMNVKDALETIKTKVAAK